MPGTQVVGKIIVVDSVGIHHDNVRSKPVFNRPNGRADDSVAVTRPT